MKATAEALRKAEAAHQAASRQSDKARAVRDQTIREAIRLGWTHAQISNATGLTRGRIGQIATRRDATSAR